MPSLSPSLSCALDGESCLEGSPNEKECCGTLTCNLLTNKCEKFCAQDGEQTNGCKSDKQSPNPNHPPNCCSGLECEVAFDEDEKTTYCVEPQANVCSRMDNTPGNGTRLEGYNFGYAKNCGATNAPNVICCPRTACDHTPLAKHEKKPKG